jgi:hypothetical protein
MQRGVGNYLWNLREVFKNSLKDLKEQVGNLKWGRQAAQRDETEPG